MLRERAIFALGLSMLSLLLASCHSAVTGPPLSDHFDGSRFYNPTLPKSSGPGFSDVFKMVRERRSRWPSSLTNQGVPRLHERLGSDDVAITFVNHATFLIQRQGLNILTDPSWSKRAGPFNLIGPARVRLPGVKFDDLPHIDLVLISHNHYDHLDLETLERLHQRFAPRVLVAQGDKELVESTGMKDVKEMDWWESVQVLPGITVTFAPTQHFSGRGLFRRQKSLWGSYMIQERGRRIYFGGDAAYSAHYAEIRKRLGSPDFALLGIGAYEPRFFMKQMHMNPAEAVQAHEDLGSKQSIAMHFGTFQMSSEGIEQPLKDLKAALLKKGIPQERFIALQEGETRIYRVLANNKTTPESRSILAGNR